MEERHRPRRWKRSSIVMACLLTTAVVLFSASWKDDGNEKPRSGGVRNHDHANMMIGGRRRVTNQTGVIEATPPGRKLRLKGSSGQIPGQDMFAAGHRSMHFISGYKTKKTKVVKKKKKMKKQGMLIVKGRKKKKKKKAKRYPKKVVIVEDRDPEVIYIYKSKKQRPPRPPPRPLPPRPPPRPRPPPPRPDRGCPYNSDRYWQCCDSWRDPDFNNACIQVNCRTEDCPTSMTTIHHVEPHLPKTNHDRT